MSYWECDEASAFDYLAILEVKVDKFQMKAGWNSYRECFENIRNELDYNLFTKILDSSEYKALYDANILTFDLVEKARHGKEEDVTAKEVDDANFKRYYAKQALQKKFFGQELKEFKN